MKTLEQQLCQYAAYHRDRRNIATHFVGIPMIVLASAALLARPAWLVGGVALSPALAATVGAIIFYFALDLRFGLAMGAFMGAAWWAGSEVAARSTALWLTYGVGLFVAGWIIQFVGHAFEGRKPAFVDDLVGLLVGPLFIVAEAAFALGLRRSLHATLEERVGPTVVRDAAARAALRTAAQ